MGDQHIKQTCCFLLQAEEDKITSAKTVIVILTAIVKVKFTLQEPMKTHRGSRGIALLFLNLVTKWGWVVSATPWPPYPRGRDPEPIVQEAPGLVWTSVENLTSNGIPSPDHPARNKSLY